LNPVKIQLKRDKVHFIGHVASKDGLYIDPAKVKRISDSEILKPQDVAGIQHLLDFAQYLSKFLPCLSDVTKPL